MPKLRDYKGKHQGERCFVVGNGPSLKRTALEQLNGDISFGANACGRFFDWTDWRPTYYVADTTMLMDEHYKPFSHRAIQEAAASFIFHDAPYDESGPEEIHRMLFIHSELTPGLPRSEWWSDDPTKHLTRYVTISLVSLQMAAWMGCDPIYVIGMDLDFKPHDVRGTDPNHADPDYNLPQPLVDWQKLERAHNLAHGLALENAERLGIEIINATIGGKLEIYPRVEFDSLFNGRQQ